MHANKFILNMSRVIIILSDQQQVERPVATKTLSRLEILCPDHPASGRGGTSRRLLQSPHHLGDYLAAQQHCDRHHGPADDSVSVLPIQSYTVHLFILIFSYLDLNSNAHWSGLVPPLKTHLMAPCLMSSHVQTPPFRKGPGASTVSSRGAFVGTTLAPLVPE